MSYSDQNTLDTAVVGLGGIGVHVARAMASWLSHRHPGSTLLLIDADHWEPHNLERVADASPGTSKAHWMAGQLQALKNIRVIPVPLYLKDDNAGLLFAGASVVFGCPDNHPTRKVIEDYAATQDTITAILGGNEGMEDPSGGTYGSAVLYRRLRGVDTTPRPSLAHPELRVDTKLTRRIGCDLQIPSTPQLLFTNLAVAAAMLSLFYSSGVGQAHPTEVNLDVALCRHIPVRR